MANKQISVIVDVDSSKVDATAKKLGELKDFGKGLKIQYDIDGKPIDVVLDKSLNLQRQVKILTAELRRTKEGTAEFQLLSSKLGDAQDALAKTTAKSKDLFSSLSLLPGPIGQFFGQLNGAIGLLKTFSSFSLKDLQFQLKETLNDIKDIGKGFLGLGDSKKGADDLTKSLKETAAQAGATSGAIGNLTKSTTAVVDADGKLVDIKTNMINATKKQGQAVAQGTVALKAAGAAALQLGEAEKVATFWTTTLGRTIQGVLIGTGIGIAIVLIGELISALYSMASGEEEAKKAVDDLSDAIERQNILLAESLGQIDFENKKKLLLAKIANKSEKDLTEITQEGLKQRYQLIRNANSAALQEQKDLANRVGKYAKISDETRATLLEKNLENLKKLGDDETKAREAIELNKLEAEVTSAQKSRETQKGGYDKKIEDAKTAEQTLLDLKKENALSSIKDERIRQYKELELQAATEVDKINALKISDAKKEEIRNQIFLKYAKKQIDLKDKFNKEDMDKAKELADKKATFEEKLEQYRIDAIANATEKEKEERQKKYDNELKELDKALKDKLISEQQYNAAIINIKKSLDNDIKKIDDDKTAKDLEAKQKKLDDDIKILEIQIGAEKNTWNAYWDDRQKLLDTAKERELAETDISEAKKNAIEKKYVQLSKDLQKEKFNATLGFISAGLSAFSNAIGQQQQINQLAQQNELDAAKGNAAEQDAIKKKYFEKNKKTQIAQAIIGTLQGAVQAYQSLAVIPVVGPALGAVAAAAALVFGYKQVSLIKAQEYQGADAGGGSSAAPQANYGKNYADGGMINGPRHSQGGVPINAEGGEAVMTRGSVTMFRPLLSMMNQMGGGTSFMPNLTTTSFDAPKTSNPAEDNKPMVIKSYVVSSELTNDQQRQARLKDLSTL